MGFHAWGGGLFESDHVVDFISGAASKELGVNINFIGMTDHYAASDPACTDKNCTHKPKAKSVEGTCKHLNKGSFTRVFNKYKNTASVHEHVTGHHACMVLAAKAMSVGADISMDQRDFLRNKLWTCGMHKEGIEQMTKALNEYPNGNPYTLVEPDRTDHNIKLAFDYARAGCINSNSGILEDQVMNFLGPKYFAKDKPTHTNSLKTVKNFRRRNAEPAYFPEGAILRECAHCDKLPEEVVGGLKFCGRCKKVMYCSPECQKKNWKAVHSKHCAAMASLPPPEPVESLPCSQMCEPGYDPLAEKTLSSNPDGPAVYMTRIPMAKMKKPKL